MGVTFDSSEQNDVRRNDGKYLVRTIVELFDNSDTVAPFRKPRFFVESDPTDCKLHFQNLQRMQHYVPHKPLVSFRLQNHYRFVGMDHQCWTVSRRFVRLRNSPYTTASNYRMCMLFAVLLHLVQKHERHKTQMVVGHTLQRR